LFPAGYIGGRLLHSPVGPIRPAWIAWNDIRCHSMDKNQDVFLVGI
jgi:hypothetical protein